MTVEIGWCCFFQFDFISTKCNSVAVFVKSLNTEIRYYLKNNIYIYSINYNVMKDITEFLYLLANADRQSKSIILDLKNTIPSFRAGVLSQSQNEPVMAHVVNELITIKKAIKEKIEKIDKIIQNASKGPASSYFNNNCDYDDFIDNEISILNIIEEELEFCCKLTNKPYQKQLESPRRKPHTHECYHEFVEDCVSKRVHTPSQKVLSEMHQEIVPGSLPPKPSQEVELDSSSLQQTPIIATRLEPIIKGVRGLASELGVSTTTAQAILNKGILQKRGIAYRVGHSWRIKRQELHELRHQDPEVFR